MKLIVMACLATSASCSVAIQGPRRALKLRGGASISDAARVVGAGCTLVDATLLYTYGPKLVCGSDIPAEVSTRSLGQWNFGLAVLLLADASNMRELVALSHYVCAINLLSDVPANDATGAPHAPILVLTAVFGALGYGTSRGVVPLWLTAASGIGNGLQFFLTPKKAWAAYGADGKGVSDTAVAWTRLVGWSIVLRGIYTGSLILGAARKDAIGYTFAAAALNALRFALSGDAATVGVSKKVSAFYVAIPLLVATASLAFHQLSELRPTVHEAHHQLVEPSPPSIENALQMCVPVVDFGSVIFVCMGRSCWRAVDPVDDKNWRVFF